MKSEGWGGGGGKAQRQPPGIDRNSDKTPFRDRNGDKRLSRAFVWRCRLRVPVTQRERDSHAAVTLLTRGATG